MADGFKTTLTTEKYLEIPDYAVLIQNAVKEIGGNIDLNIMDQGAYYGDAVYGKSPWLDSDMGITDYGHRGVPNVFLSAPLKSDGTWNSAHFKNNEYDTLVNGYVAALDLESQHAIAGKIQDLLLDETPVLFTYFYDFLTATKKGSTGVEATAMSHLILNTRRFRGPLMRNASPLPANAFTRKREAGQKRERHDRLSAEADASVAGHAMAAEPAGLRRRPMLARQCRSRHARPLRRPAGGRCPQSRDGHRPASARSIWQLDGGLRHRRSRTILCLSRAGIAVPRHGAAQLRQAGAWWPSSSWCRSAYWAAWWRPSIGGRAVERIIYGRRPFGHRRAGIRLRHRADPDLRRLAAMVSDLGDLAERCRFLHPDLLSLSPVNATGARAVRLHRPHGAGRHDRGTRHRVYPHRHPQGPAAPRSYGATCCATRCCRPSASSPRRRST